MRNSRWLGLLLAVVVLAGLVVPSAGPVSAAWCDEDYCMGEASYSNKYYRMYLAALSRAGVWRMTSSDAMVPQAVQDWWEHSSAWSATVKNAMATIKNMIDVFGIIALDDPSMHSVADASKGLFRGHWWDCGDYMCVWGLTDGLKLYIQPAVLNYDGMRFWINGSNGFAVGGSPSVWDVYKGEVDISDINLSNAPGGTDTMGQKAIGWPGSSLVEFRLRLTGAQEFLMIRKTTALYNGGGEYEWPAWTFVDGAAGSPVYDPGPFDYVTDPGNPPYDCFGNFDPALCPWSFTGPTPTALPTATPTATVTPTATATPVPSATPTPRATYTPLAGLPTSTPLPYVTPGPGQPPIVVPVVPGGLFPNLGDLLLGLFRPSKNMEDRLDGLKGQMAGRFPLNLASALQTCSAGLFSGGTAALVLPITAFGQTWDLVERAGWYTWGASLRPITSIVAAALLVSYLVGVARRFFGGGDG